MFKKDFNLDFKMTNLKSLYETKPIVSINENYEIEDFNLVARNLFPKIKKGEKCYKVFFNKNLPCPFKDKYEECPLKNLTEKKNDIFIKLFNNNFYLVESIKENKSKVNVLFLTNIEKIINKFKFGDPLLFKKFVEKLSKKLSENEHVYISYIKIENFQDIASTKGLEASLWSSYTFRNLLSYFSKKFNIEFFSLSDHEYLTFFNIKKNVNPILLEHEILRELLIFEKKALEKNILVSTLLLTTKIAKSNINLVKDGILEAFLSLRNSEIVEKFVQERKGKQILKLDPIKLKEYIEEKRKKIDILERAIKNKSVIPYFQPIVSTRDKKIKYLEVLMRIKDKDKIYSAGYFIEELLLHNFIDLDIILLEKLKEYKSQILSLNIPLNINLSHKQLANFNYRKALWEFINFFKKENPNFTINLEITEQILFRNYKFISLLKKEFENLKFAIDDFGAGYSSLSLVADLAKENLISMLKIDGSLVKNVKNNPTLKSILKAISIFSQELNLECVAEFIENEILELIVDTLGIKLGQGYYYSPPKPLENILCEIKSHKK